MSYVKVQVTNDEIAAYVAEAALRRQSKYPRCDCQGNKQLERKWKEDAKADICGFLKNQYGKEPRLLDGTDKRAIKRDCSPFLPKDKMKMLTEQKGRPSKTFWADFCSVKPTSKQNKEMTPQQALELFKAMFPKTNSRAKKLEDIAFSVGQRKRIMADSLLMAKLGVPTRRALGLMARPGKQKKFAKLSQAMSLTDAEAYVLNALNAVTKTAHRDPGTGRIVIDSRPRRTWRLIAREFGHKLPQDFLDVYSEQLAKKTPGRKRKVLDPNQPIVSQKKKRVKKTVKVKRVGDDEHAKMIRVQHEQAKKVVRKQAVLDDEEVQDRAPKPKTKITTPEKLNQFINNLMKMYDSSYGLSTHIRDWSNPEWALVDTNRESVEPALLEKYQTQIDRARSVLGIRSGGAYASIRDNKELAQAHVITAWLCGDLE